VPLDRQTRELLDSFASFVRAGRRGRRWTQRRLAHEVGVSQSQVDRIEHAAVRDLSIRRTVGFVDALGGRLNVTFSAPQGAPRVRDAAHARAVAYVARRLDRQGYLVATEVEVSGERWRAFADVVAFHPTERLLLVIEVKTEILDLGDIDRQLGVAERGSWAAAHQRGWRPRRVIGVLLVLATQANDRRLAQHRAIFHRQYPVRWQELYRLLNGDRTSEPGRGARGLAMIDPRSRRRAWLQATWIDGRRTLAPYADRLAYLASA